MLEVIFSVIDEHGDGQSAARDDLGQLYMAYHGSCDKGYMRMTAGVILDWLMGDGGLSLEQASMVLLLEPGAIVDFPPVTNYSEEVEDEDGNCPF